MPITLRIQAEAPQKAIDDTKQGVTEIKREAREAGIELSKAFGSGLAAGVQDVREMARSFATVKTQQDRMRDGVGMLERMRTNFERMRNVVTPLEKSMRGLADAIDQERRMLESIRGPFERYQQQVRVLDSLHQRGKITAREYAEALRQAGQEANLPSAGPKGFFGGVRQGMSGGMGVGGAAGIGGSIGSSLAGIAGPAALAATAIGAITEAFNEWREHEKMVRTAENSMLRFTGTMAKAKIAVVEHQLASRVLGVTVHEQIEAFDAVSDANESLAKTHGQLMDVTRNLSMVMIHEGKSMSDVNRVMETLQFGMSKGTLESRELRSIIKEFPPVVDMWGKSLGKTREELLKMAENGQIGRREITKFISSMEDGTEITKVFGERNLDISQIMETQKVGFMEAYNIYVTHASAIKNATKELDEFEKGLRATNEALNDLSAQSEDWGKKIDAAQIKLWQQSFDAHHQKNLKIVTDGVKAYNDAVQKYKAVYDSIVGPQRDHEHRVRVINSLYDAGKISLEQYQDAMLSAMKTSPAYVKFMEQQEKAAVSLRKQGEAIMMRNRTGVDSPAAHGFTGQYRQWGDGRYSNDQAQRDAAQFEAFDKKGAMGIDTLEDEWLKNYEAQVKANADRTKAWHDELDRLRKQSDEVTNKIANGFGQIGKSIVEMALDGKSSVNDMIRSIAAQMLSFMMSATIRGFMNMMNGGSFAGGVTGLKLPGFASGGIIPPGGSGGTDSQVVAFRKSPDETVRITTPSQESSLQSAVRGGGGPAMGGTTIHNHVDAASIVGTFLRSPEGERMIANTVTRHAPAIRGRTDGR